MTLAWPVRDFDIVETVTRRVSTLTIQQIALIWWPGCPLRLVRNRLRRLTAAGLLRRTIVNIHPLLELSSPLVSWAPGDEQPNFELISQSTRCRWTQPAAPAEVYSSTALAANLFGSTARQFPDVNHRDHDLLLGQVYALYRTTRSEEAQCWIGEHALPKAGFRIKDPDAFLVDETGRVLRVVESAGHYSKKQIASFHQYCVDYDFSYELW